jgi:ankyrin repeat protein
MFHASNSYAKKIVINSIEDELFLKSVQKGDLGEITKYLDSGVSLNEIYSMDGGYNALMAAAEVGRLKSAEYLISRGAKLNEVNSYGCTALMLAVNNGHEKIVDLLLEKGADADVKDEDGRTALEGALEKNNDKIVSVFEKHGKYKGVKNIETQILPKSSNSKLNDNDLSGLTKADLELALNEIYARHGWIFKRKDLAEYFGARPWYKPSGGEENRAKINDKIESELSPLEKENIDLIRKYKNKH